MHTRVCRREPACDWPAPHDGMEDDVLRPRGQRDDASEGEAMSLADELNPDFVDWWRSNDGAPQFLPLDDSLSVAAVAFAAGQDACTEREVTLLEEEADDLRMEIVTLTAENKELATQMAELKRKRKAVRR